MISPRPAAAIPAFARTYGKPCHACHTVFPQLNAAGEAFRAHGLHGLTPVFAPLKLGDHLAVPGTWPIALSFGFGDDLTHSETPGADDSTRTHFNLHFLSLLAGGELGPHLSFLADYAPVFTNAQTGDVDITTRPGIAWVNAHHALDGWLGNLKLGLFELPLGTSPRVHRLSVRPYLVYSVGAYRFLGQQPPVSDKRRDSFVPASAQIGGELGTRHESSGLEAQAGVTLGSNARIDNNDSVDVYARVGRDLGPWRSGVFVYYSPDIVSSGVNDSAWRFGPDVTYLARRVRLNAQLLGGRDSNPTAKHTALWFCGGFVEAQYRFTTTTAALLRMDYAGMLDFDDRRSGGGSHVRRNLWEATTGAQYLWRENLKLVAELTYAENHEAVRDRTARTVAATLRVVTAFWPLTPPLLFEEPQL